MLTGQHYFLCIYMCRNTYLYICVTTHIYLCK